MRCISRCAKAAISSYEGDTNGEYILRLYLCLYLKRLFLQQSRELYQELGEYLYWDYDTHWNDYGQEAAAVEVLGILRRDRNYETRNC